MLLIGSQALQQHGIETGRPILDVDYICSYGEFREWVEFAKPNKYWPLSGNKFVAHVPNGIKEFEIAWPGSTAAMLLEIEHCTKVASLEALLALKLSHRYLRNSPAFLKTMRDIQLLRSLGVELTSALKEWLPLREKETYTYAHPKLNQNKMGFFDQSVTYVYDHDAVHRAVALYEKPAYTMYMRDGMEVQCDRQKFFVVRQDIRIAGVLEEAYVLALERSIIPYPGVLTPRQAFEKALMKVCTSITSGWFREWAWEHYDLVLSQYNDWYVQNFEDAVERGEVPFANQEKEKM